MQNHLFKPLTVGVHRLKNRIIMAPLTRLRAVTPGDIPSALAVTYYSQRASAGLIITEATDISPQARGCEGAPGLYTDEQITAWQGIVDAVHTKGGRIVVQLWHTGLVSHCSLQPQRRAPISASALNLGCRVSLRDRDGYIIRTEATPSRAATIAEIEQVIADFAHAARCARAAGFDGIEIHGAHGYLLQQFWNEQSNLRKDSYGASKENRARLLLAVTDACIAAWDAEHVGLRLSPFGTFNGVEAGYNDAESLWLIEQLNQRNMMYLHLSECEWAGGKAYTDAFRHAVRETFTQPIIVAGGYTPERAEKIVASGYADAVAFGRAYIANPDLVERIRCGAVLNERDVSTTYGGGVKGYTDYPALNLQQ